MIIKLKNNVFNRIILDASAESIGIEPAAYGVGVYLGLFTDENENIINAEYMIYEEYLSDPAAIRGTPTSYSGWGQADNSYPADPPDRWIQPDYVNPNGF